MDHRIASMHQSIFNRNIVPWPPLTAPYIPDPVVSRRLTNPAVAMEPPQPNPETTAYHKSKQRDRLHCRKPINLPKTVQQDLYFASRLLQQHYNPTGFRIRSRRSRCNQQGQVCLSPLCFNKLSVIPAPPLFTPKNEPYPLRRHRGCF